MGGLGSIFTLISLVYVYNAYKLGRQIWQNWNTFKSDPLTPQKQAIAERAAFLLAVPPSVLLHELFHALTVWAVNGRVVGGGFFFFWGYVSHVGNYTPFESWAISFSGTIGSLLFGIGIWLALRQSASAPLRYFGLRSLRLQIILSLIYYPIFTALIPIGDWRTIYDFQATPLLSGGTAVFHALTLLFFWRLDRQGWFEQLSFSSIHEQRGVDQLLQRQRDGTLTDEESLSLAIRLRNGGAYNQAQKLFDELYQTNPHDSQLLYERSILQIMKNRGTIPKSVINDLSTALQAGLSDGRQMMIGHQILGEHFLEVGDFEASIHHFSNALTSGKVAANNSDWLKRLSTIYASRSVAYRQKKQFETAMQDIDQAITLAQQNNDAAALKKYQEERTIIQDHSARSRQQ